LPAFGALAARQIRAERPRRAHRLWPFASEPVFAVTRSGLELLELRGMRSSLCHPTAKDIVRRSQVLHSVELAAICAALTLPMC